MKRIRVVETLGPTLENLLCKASPWKARGCSREDCFPCQHGGGTGGDCQSEGVTYAISCLECKKNNVEVEYIGETARTIYDRGEEHLSDLINEVKGKPLWEHIVEKHESRYEIGWFKIRLLMKHRTALQRQIREALKIENSGAEIILNKKNEWNESRIPRLRVEIADKIEEEVKTTYEENNFVKNLRKNFKKKHCDKRKQHEQQETVHNNNKKRQLY